MFGYYREQEATLCICTLFSLWTKIGCLYNKERKVRTITVITEIIRMNGRYALRSNLNEIN